MPVRLVRMFARISWPQAAVLVAFMASAVAALAFTPPELIEKAAEVDWRAVGAVVTAGLTALAGILGGPLLREGERASEPPPRPWERPGFDEEDPTSPAGPRALDRRDRGPGDGVRGRRSGSASPLALAVVLWCGLGLVAAVLSGCGGSAIRRHADGAAIATVTIEGVRGVYLEDLDRRLAACAELECVGRERAATRDLETGIDSAGIAVRAWRDGIEVALLGEESEEAIAAISAAGLRAWARLREVLELAASRGLELGALGGVL